MWYKVAAVKTNVWILVLFFRFKQTLKDRLRRKTLKKSFVLERSVQDVFLSSNLVEKLYKRSWSFSNNTFKTVFCFSAQFFANPQGAGQFIKDVTWKIEFFICHLTFVWSVILDYPPLRSWRLLWTASKRFKSFFKRKLTDNFSLAWELSCFFKNLSNSGVFFFVFNKIPFTIF